SFPSLASVKVPESIFCQPSFCHFPSSSVSSVSSCKTLKGNYGRNLAGRSVEQLPIHFTPESFASFPSFGSVKVPGMDFSASHISAISTHSKGNKRALVRYERPVHFQASTSSTSCFHNPLPPSEHRKPNGKTPRLDLQ